MFPHNQEVLFTCQKHEAEKAGTHYDYRIVVGDKAYSWATFKDLPEPGKAIVLHEQPTHTAAYALSKKVIIPSGQYGAGITNLLYAKKGKVKNEEGAKDKFVIETNGERYLIRHVPKYGEKQWLFKNLGEVEKKASDLSIATKSHEEESKAVHDYTRRLKDAKSPELKKAIEHARSEERDHSAEFKKLMDKAAMLIQQYQHKKTGKTQWVTEKNKKPSKVWKPTGKNKYVRKAVAIKPQMHKTAAAVMRSPAVIALARAKAAALAAKGNRILGPTLKKIEAIKDPYVRIAVSMGRY